MLENGENPRRGKECQSLLNEYLNNRVSRIREAGDGN